MNNIIFLNKLKNSSILITGATGLIGTAVVKYLMKLNEDDAANIQVYAVVRSLEKAGEKFGEYLAMDANARTQDTNPQSLGSGLSDSNLHIITCEDITRLEIPDIHIDYIIHGANPTSSRYFVLNPVETLDIASRGTKHMLEIARDRAVRGFIFLSTMEIYGEPEPGHRVKEHECGSFDTTVVRNSYPLSKMFCENMCTGYWSEYGVPTYIARLTQTFGEGVEYNDGRVFAEFARCAIEQRNIVLKTRGETERCYLYVEDAVTGILTILASGNPGEAYTVANEDTFCSIYEMASMVARANGIEVVIEEQDITGSGYAGTLHMDLDTSKLQALGWKPTRSLGEMYEAMIEYMRKGNR